MTTANNTFQETTTGNHQETTVTPTIIVEQCNSCNSTKRRSLFLASIEEDDNHDQQQHYHISKKPNLSPEPSYSAAGAASHLATQFTNIHISAPTTLRRTFSEPISPPMNPNFLKPNSPEILAEKTQSPVAGISRIERCVSDPTPVLGFPASSPESKIEGGKSLVTKTPKTSLISLRQRALLRRRRNRAGRMVKKGTDESTGEKLSREEKVNKMKEIIGLTSHWSSQIVQENDEPQQGVQDSHVAETSKEEEEEIHDVGEKCVEEEAVSVEKCGECLVIQFKCNCNKTYQILLSGDACYYKLM